MTEADVKEIKMLLRQLLLRLDQIASLAGRPSVL